MTPVSKASPFTTAQPPMTTGAEAGWTPAPMGDANTWREGAEPVPGYRLVQMLGRGGFGEVWKAMGPGDVAVALKYVTLDTQAATVEARALSLIKDIHHPHLLPLFGAWQVGGNLIMAMELAEGSLFEQLQSARRLGQPGIPEETLFEWMLDAAKGLDYLNENHPQAQGDWGKGIQHRDIKPQNLLLVGGSVKIADFGLAKVMAQAMASHSGSLTIPYAAPEFFSGHTARTSDQYSLAATYCHLRTGQLPFVGSATEIMAGHLTREPDLSALPAVERQVVRRALAKDPAERWQSCKAFINALTHAAHAVPGSTSHSRTFRQPAPNEAPPPQCEAQPKEEELPARLRMEQSKRRCLAGLAAVMAVSLISCGIANRVLTERQAQPEQPSESK